MTHFCRSHPYLLKKLPAACAIVIALAVVYGCYVEISSGMQAILGWLLVLCLWVIRQTMNRFTQFQRILLVILSLFLAGRYWFFRTFDTLSFAGFFDSSAMILLYLAESYAIAIHLLGMFTNIYPLRRKIEPVDLNRNDLPTVDIFIPTYNEAVSIVEITAIACTQLDYPREKFNVYILDDGGTTEKLQQKNNEAAMAARKRKNELEELAAGLGILYMTRDANLHAKAGNINHALLNTEQEGSGGELIAIFDCDHVPARDFLQNTVGHFLDDDKLFLVQTPHFFLNPDPVEKNLDTFMENPGENEMFYGAVQLGMDFWNASFFCGSAALLRRSLLLKHGGIAGDTITEDAETALNLHGKGYNSVYVSRPLVCGLSPETLDGFILQRSRWTQGMVQIFLLKNPLFNKGLSLPQKICYLNSTLFWFFTLARGIFYLAPLGFLFFGLRIYDATSSQIFTYAVPHVVGVIIVADYLYGKVRHPFFSEVYETLQGFALLPALLGALIRPRSPVFKVTPKGTMLEKDFLSPIGRPFYHMLILSLTACPVAIFRWYYYPLDRGTVVICSFWLLFNLFLTLQCLGIVWEKKQRREHHRAVSDQEGQLVIDSTGKTISGRIADISLTGFRFVTPELDNLSRANEVFLHARDSTGRLFKIPAVIVRRSSGHDSSEVGCAFVCKDENCNRQRIAFLYGDSQRWEYFWNKRRQREVNVLEGYLYLLRKGISGTYKNFFGLAAPAFEHAGKELKRIFLKRGQHV